MTSKYLCNVAGWVVVEAHSVTEARRLAAIQVNPGYAKKPWLWERVEAHIATPDELERYAVMVDAKRPRVHPEKGIKTRPKTREKLF